MTPQGGLACCAVMPAVTDGMVVLLVVVVPALAPLVVLVVDVVPVLALVAQRAVVVVVGLVVVLVVVVVPVLALVALLLDFETGQPSSRLHGFRKFSKRIWWWSRGFSMISRLIFEAGVVVMVLRIFRSGSGGGPGGRGDGPMGIQGQLEHARSDSRGDCSAIPPARQGGSRPLRFINMASPAMPANEADQHLLRKSLRLPKRSPTLHSRRAPGPGLRARRALAGPTYMSITMTFVLQAFPYVIFPPFLR